MAGATGVLSFVRGIDLSRYDFSVGHFIMWSLVNFYTHFMLQSDQFPKEVGSMNGLRWLKLNYNKIERVPDELSNLTDLEHLQMVHNELTSVHGELSDMPRLRSVIVRHNKIKTAGIPSDIFAMKDLTLIDFSHNSLKDVPPNVERAKCAIVLNLSHNNIETLPNQVFVNLVDLLHLNLAHNKLITVPPQLRRLTLLQVLDLSDNPTLSTYQLKCSPLRSLRVLRMANTARTDSTVPELLDCLEHLEEIDLSRNSLTRVPDSLFAVSTLRRVDVSDNRITEIRMIDQKADTVFWPKLEVLNVCRNELSALPEPIVRMSSLRMLFANNNNIDFNGLPPSIGKLSQLQVLHLACNRLELVPEGLGRCVKLKRLKLNNNRLITMPESIHLLPDLKELDVRNNPNLVLPPKPSDKKRMQYYNIDFSLGAQLKAAASPSSSSVASTPSVLVKALYSQQEYVAVTPAANSDEKRILQGMADIAKERERAEEALAEDKARRPKKWNEHLNKPAIDYSELFDDELKFYVGMTVWEIENLYPNLMEDCLHGKFYEGDCYIVLNTTLSESGHPDYRIWYWIGEKATLDKMACAAIHAVNLRNFLGATCRTIREEMNDESDEFIELFGDEIVYIDGERTASGFYTVEPTTWPTRLYRIIERGAQVYAEPVSVSAESLDPRFTFVLDKGLTMYVWCGRKCKCVLRSKARLFCEKISRNERKGVAEIEMVHQYLEPPQFWRDLIGTEKRPEEPIVEHVPTDFEPLRPILYQLRLGMGYLELPQLELPGGRLTQSQLSSRSVYILDCHSDVFLWIGKQSTRLVRAAGHKLVTEVHKMITRPEHSQVHRCVEGREPMIFKSKFFGWDDVIAVDFTRTADSVQRRGADLKVIMERDKLKTDLSALFLERQMVMSDSEADTMIEECNEDLDAIEPFVLEGRKFVRLPTHEYGVFYSCDCYVFLCRYWMPPEDDVDETAANAAAQGNDGGSDGEQSDRSTASPAAPTAQQSNSTDFQCVVYFWQGRDASNMGWLTFTFSLRKKFEALFKDKLDVVRMYQQQENHKFLSHFKKKLVIRRGRRNLIIGPGMPHCGWPELFHVRANGSSICTRTINVDCRTSELISGFAFILRAPYKYPEDDGTLGRIYIWVGKGTPASQVQIAHQVASELLNKNNFPIVEVAEGAEPERFWEFMKGSESSIERDCDFMQYTRLFRCTNEKGYFAVSEKTIDFCQDDLDDEDPMLLDNGRQVFLWLGARASEVEIKLAYKAAQVYVQHMRLKQPERPRKLVATLKGREPRRFTKCFHAWGKHKVPAGDS